MGWTSALVKVGSRKSSTPSYLPITTFPFPHCLFFVASHFSHHCRRHWKGGTPPNLSSLKCVPLFKFQVSSKPCVWLFHLFSFQSLASFKEQEEDGKKWRRQLIFSSSSSLLWTSSLVKKICNSLRRGICCSQKNVCVVKNQAFFFLVLFARSSHQHMFWK
jgi:hypothetical protein